MAFRADALSAKQQLVLCSKENKYEDAKGNAVDGSRCTRSRPGGVGCAGRLLRVGGLLCRLFRV